MTKTQSQIFAAARGIKLALAACLLVCAAGCGDGEKARTGTPPAPVRVASLEQASITRELTAVGNVRASATVGVLPRVAGEILEINFIEGQNVREGDQLARIDPRPYEAELREKRGILAKSEAQLAKARRDSARYGKLVGNGYVSREAFEQMATDAMALEATVRADKAAVENAELNLSYCSLAAPISGRIGALNLNKGNMVKSGDATPIAQIDTLSPCYATFSVPEANLPVILEQMKKGPVALTATPTGGQPENGELTLVDNNVDTKTGTIRLRATFQNKEQKLWPGQFVEIRLPLGVVENALLVPSKAIQAGRDENFIYVIDANNQADYKKVDVLFENGGKTAIEADLEPGLKVVVEGQMRLAPGSPVRIL